MHNELAWTRSKSGTNSVIKICFISFQGLFLHHKECNFSLYFLMWLSICLKSNILLFLKVFLGYKLRTFEIFIKSFRYYAGVINLNSATILSNASFTCLKSCYSLWLSTSISNTWELVRDAESQAAKHRPIGSKSSLFFNRITQVICVQIRFKKKWFKPLFKEGEKSWGFNYH